MDPLSQLKKEMKYKGGIILDLVSVCPDMSTKNKREILKTLTNA